MASRIKFATRRICVFVRALRRLSADVVVVVGYGVSGNTPFFLAKNSW
jgi:hypothetical protein